MLKQKRLRNLRSLIFLSKNVLFNLKKWIFQFCDYMTFTLPATQTLTENSFGNGANPMVAKSNSNYLAFRNVCGGIAVRLYGASTGTMDKIVVTGKNGKKLNGTYTVSYSGNTPSATLTSGNTNVITLESASPITLSASSASPTVFYVMLPAGDYSDGFNVTAYGNNGTIKLLDQDFASVPTVERNRLYLLAPTQVSGVPAVTTSAATSIGTTTATLNGNLTYAGIPAITEKGFVYSTTASTTSGLIVDGSGCTKVTVDGTATGAYTYNATGLSLGTKYYVRAYAINDVSATPVYGDVVEFTTSSIPGTLASAKEFSLSSTTKVYFSKSNLVYNSKYMFSDDQTYYVNTASLSADPRTFFNWSTACGMASQTIYDSDGSTLCNTGWRVLTKTEWAYLLERTVNGNAGDGGAYRRVTLTDSKDGIYGMIIFPDNYTGTVPSNGASITKATFERTYETAGCVFLPASGYLYGSSVLNDGSHGYYWSSTESSSSAAHDLRFDLYSVSVVNVINSYSKTCGEPVRLVLAK